MNRLTSTIIGGMVTLALLSSPTLVGASASIRIAEAAPPQTAAVESAASISCGVTRWDMDASSYGTYFYGDGINIRNGPSDSAPKCTVLGKGYRLQLVDYHCYEWGRGGTWTYLRNVSTGVQGWVKDSMLRGDGSQVRC